ncbi:MAG: homocysteine S-methyltransferase family protein [Eubacteriales bacterium]
MEKREFRLTIWKSFLIALVNGLGIPMMLYIPIYFISIFITVNPEHPLIQSLINIIAGGFLVYYFNRKNKLDVKASFTYFPNILTILLGLIPFMMGFSIIVSEFDNWFRSVLPMSDYYVEVFSDLYGDNYGVISSVIMIAFVAPIVEEFVFRGLIFKGLSNRYPPFQSMVISALIFAIAHLNPWQFAVAFGWGMVAAWLYRQTKSLIPCILGHIINNSLSFIFIYILHWDIPGYTSVYETTVYQPLWFDMFGIALLMLGGVILIYATRESEGDVFSKGDGMTIKEKIGKELLLFDGALGTLISVEAPKTKIPDELNITNPELMKKIHRMYVDAGSDIITTNTFGANDFKLQNSAYAIEDIVQWGVRNAREVAKNRYIALDIGPTGKLIQPLGDLTFEEAYLQFKRQVTAGEKAGCDLIIIETMSDLLEAKIAVLAAKENTNLPVICSMTFNEKGKTINGTDAMTMVAVMEGLGVDAVGINCSFGPDKLLPVVKQIMHTASIPVIVQPNAGLPVVKDNRVTYDISKEKFVAYIQEMVKLGVSIVGGCCGTTPEYISGCKEMLRHMHLKEVNAKKQITVATSSRSTVIFDGITVIGEALVPTGREKYSQALKENQISFFSRSAKEQMKLGAQIININVSIPGIDEKEAMLKGIKRISSSVDCPLQIDSIYPEIIETALRYYPGKGIINSVNGKETSMNTIFPIAKKYGACIIGMTFDENGIPRGVESRFSIAEKIVRKAMGYGIPKNNIIIDCLSLSAKVYQDYLMDTLEVVKRVKNELGVKTMLGIANVSYGLPNRRLLDRTYFAMALAQGLDVVMMSVYDDEMLDTLYAYRVLAKIDFDAGEYISKYQIERTMETSLKTVNHKNSHVKIILTAVKGDTVNTGVNVLSTMLEEHGYIVKNLGVDVDKETILAQALQLKCDIIGLSAFSPFSLDSMEETVKYIKKYAPSVKIMVGGASVKDGFAKQIGADYYAVDAPEAVKLLAALNFK